MAAPDKKTYDAKCLDLAQHFMQDQDVDGMRDLACDDLARHVQIAVEEWLQYDLPRLRIADERG